jgi:hypothetical protein
MEFLERSKAARSAWTRNSLNVCKGPAIVMLPISAPADYGDPR